MLLELQLKLPKQKLRLLSWPKELLKMKPRQKLPPLLFRRTFKPPLMNSSRNKRSKMRKKKKSRKLLEKRKNKKDLKDSRTSERHKRNKRKNSLKR